MASFATLRAQIAHESHLLDGGRRKFSFYLTLALLLVAGCLQFSLLSYFDAAEVAGLYQLRLTGYIFVVAGGYLLLNRRREENTRLLALVGLAQKHPPWLQTSLAGGLWLSVRLLAVSALPTLLLLRCPELPRSFVLQFTLGLVLLQTAFSFCIALTRGLCLRFCGKYAGKVGVLLWLLPFVWELALGLDLKAPPRSLVGLFLRGLYLLHLDYLSYL